jgi:hypothetical protein
LRAESEARRRLPQNRLRNTPCEHCCVV